MIRPTTPPKMAFPRSHQDPVDSRLVLRSGKPSLVKTTVYVSLRLSVTVPGVTTCTSPTLAVAPLGTEVTRTS